MQDLLLQIPKHFPNLKTVFLKPSYGHLHAKIVSFFYHPMPPPPPPPPIPPSPDYLLTIIMKFLDFPRPCLKMAFPPNFPVFKKRHLSFPQNRIRNIVNCTPYVWVKRVLGMKKRNRIQHFLSQGLAVQYILSGQKALKEKQSSGRAPFVAIF